MTSGDACLCNLCLQRRTKHFGGLLLLEVAFEARQTTFGTQIHGHIILAIGISDMAASLSVLIIAQI